MTKLMDVILVMIFSTDSGAYNSRQVFDHMPFPERERKGTLHHKKIQHVSLFWTCRQISLHERERVILLAINLTPAYSSNVHAAEYIRAREVEKNMYPSVYIANMYRIYWGVMREG